MNVFEQRLRNCQVALRDAISNGHNFDMSRYHHCGTPMCVFGHYVARHDLQQEFRLGSVCSVDYVAGGGFAGICSGGPQKHFGITYDEANELFSAEGCGHAETPQQAIAYIEDFIARKWPAPLSDWNALAAEPLPVAERTAQV